VQGHTDSQGDPNKNFLLSQARAESVVSYLLSRGIDAGRLTPIGYGSDVPIAPNDTAAGREANRRVTLVPLVDSPIDPLAPQSGQDDDEYEDMDEDPDQDE
jgi:OOP family OmpA-OmpF porin